MSESDTTLLTWEMCRNLNLFIGLRCLNDPDFSWPRVRPKIGSSQECETRTWSVRYQSCLRLNNLNIPSDFIQHLLHRYVVGLKAHNTQFWLFSMNKQVVSAPHLWLSMHILNVLKEWEQRRIERWWTKILDKFKPDKQRLAFPWQKQLIDARDFYWLKFIILRLRNRWDHLYIVDITDNNHLYREWCWVRRGESRLTC